MDIFALLNRLTLPLGKWLGTKVAIHWTMTLMLVLVGFLNPHYLLVLTCMFGIVLLHEFGHVIAGKTVGIFAQSVYLTPLGGMAIFPPSCPNAKDEFVMTIGGPLVNVILIPILWGMSCLFPFWMFVAKFNLVILVFNLLPSFPMDGGRLLRSIHYYWSKDYYRATKVAVMTSKVICVMMGAFGAMTMNFMMVAIAFMIYQMADMELGQAALKLAFYGNSASPNEEVDISARNLRILRDKIRKVGR